MQYGQAGKESLTTQSFLMLQPTFTSERQCPRDLRTLCVCGPNKVSFKRQRCKLDIQLHSLLVPSHICFRTEQHGFHYGVTCCPQKHACASAECRQSF